MLHPDAGPDFLAKDFNQEEKYFVIRIMLTRQHGRAMETSYRRGGARVT